MPQPVGAEVGRTLDVYERSAQEWVERRKPRHGAAARDLRRRVRRGGVRIDLGCGPGWYTSELGRPVVALDGAAAMLDLVPRYAPHALRVQADLEALPFRRGALAGGWARATYVHVPRVRLPMALADLHDALEPGAPVAVRMFQGDYEGEELPGDDFPGRFFALWDRDHLRDVLVGAGFTVTSLRVADRAFQIQLTRARTLPDTVAAGMRLLICGLNPSIYSADVGVGYARPGNRFWPAAIAAGIVTRDRDARHALGVHGVGITDLVKRATVSAGELTTAEYRDGMGRVERLVRWLRPGAVCFVGLTGWRAAVDRHAKAGVQPEAIGGVPAYVMPSTSGLNAHARLSDLIEHLGAAAALAGA